MNKQIERNEREKGFVDNSSVLFLHYTIGQREDGRAVNRV